LSAAWPILRQKNRDGGFQLYGYDFILDTDFRVWLLEVSRPLSLFLSLSLSLSLSSYSYICVLRVSSIEV
jgi:hypothetical protein